MRRAYYLLAPFLACSIAHAQPGRGFVPGALVKSRAALRKLGMDAKSNFSWDEKLDAMGSTRVDKIRLNPDHFRNRSELLNTTAHELKHVRDNVMIHDLLTRSTTMSNDNKRALSLTDKLLTGAPNDATMARVAQLNDEVDRRFAAQDRISHLVDFLSSSPVSEYRANRAGAFAMGRLGRSLGDQHLGLPDDPIYASKDQLIHGNVSGYLLGAKVSLRRSSAYRALSQEQKATSHARMNVYLEGYAQTLFAEAKNDRAAAPDPTVGPPVLSVRKAGRAAQTSQQLHDDEALYQAGVNDAWMRLSPLGRTNELARPTQSPSTTTLDLR